MPGASSTHISTYAFGIDGGNIVGYYSDSSKHGFSYDGSAYSTVAYPGKSNTYAYGIDGDYIVGGGDRRGFKYDRTTDAGIAANYTSIQLPNEMGNEIGGTGYVYPRDIDGSKIVGHFGSTQVGNFRGFLYDEDASTYTTLHVPGASMDLSPWYSTLQSHGW